MLRYPNPSDRFPQEESRMCHEEITLQRWEDSPPEALELLQLYRRVHSGQDSYCAYAFAVFRRGAQQFGGLLVPAILAYDDVGIKHQQYGAARFLEK